MVQLPECDPKSFGRGRWKRHTPVFGDNATVWLAVNPFEVNVLRHYRTKMTSSKTRLEELAYVPAVEEHLWVMILTAENFEHGGLVADPGAALTQNMASHKVGFRDAVPPVKVFEGFNLVHLDNRRRKAQLNGEERKIADKDDRDAGCAVNYLV